jgi:hypothetical protein
VESWGAIDYAGPSPGAQQSREAALASYNDWQKPTYSMTPDGWAVATDEDGVVVSVAVFEELSKGYFVVGSEIDCA